MSKLTETTFTDFVGSPEHDLGINMQVRQDVWHENGETEVMDTGIKVSGRFAVAGPEYQEFKEKLQGLLDEYQI